jgi:hypothetical protein
VKDLEGGVSGSAKNRTDGAVLVSNVKRIDQVKVLPAPSRKRLDFDERLFDPFAGRANALARGFVFRPVVTTGELKMAILRAVVPSDEPPHGVVESAAQIVDSVAYYDRELLRNAFNEANLNSWLTGFTVMLDAKSMRLARYEGFELPLKVSNVMLCATEFLPCAIEHV